MTSCFTAKYSLQTLIGNNTTKQWSIPPSYNIRLWQTKYNGSSKFYLTKLNNKKLFQVSVPIEELYVQHISVNRLEFSLLWTTNQLFESRVQNLLSDAIYFAHSLQKYLNTYDTAQRQWCTRSPLFYMNPEYLTLLFLQVLTKIYESWLKPRLRLTEPWGCIGYKSLKRCFKCFPHV